MLLKGHLRSGFFLSFGGAVGALSNFARNIIITRLISVEDFGIATTFSMTMALIQMSTGLGVDRLIVQAVDGNDPKLQATTHAFNILRGVLLSLVMYVVASPVAHLFDLPELVWAFQWLALLPLITGFVHMDAARFQREMRFGASVLNESIPQIIVVLLAAPLALYFNDYRVMLVILFAQSLSMVAISFIVAERKYRVALNRTYLERIFSFGWPLMLNGILMFGIFQGDRAIVGIAFSMEDLGWFSAAFMLTMFPTMVLMNAVQSFFMPLLSARQQDPALFQEGAVATVKACLFIGIGISVGLALGGPALILLIFGAKYSGGVPLIGLLALMQGIRMAKAGPTIVAMSSGKTKYPLYANIIRSFALLFALFAVWRGWGVTGVVYGGIIGETMAVIFFMSLLSRKFGVNLSLLYKSILVSILLVILALVLAAQFSTGESPIIEIAGSAVITLGALGIFLVSAMDLLRWLKASNQGQLQT